MGLGSVKNLTGETLKLIESTAAEMLNKAQVKGVAIEPPAPGVSDDARAQAFLQSFLPAFKGERVAVFAEKNLSRLLTS